MVEPIGVGLIGVGTHGRRYARHIVRDVPGLRLAGVYRRGARERAEAAAEFGAPAFDTVDALLDACQAAVIATPPDAHADLALRALERDRFVLVEKPVTRTAAEARSLLARDAALGGKVMVAHTLRYDPVLRTIRSRLADIGPVHLVRMAQRPTPSSLSWQRSRTIAGGGSILLTGVHLFDTTSWLLGEPIEIRSCVTERVLNPVTEDFFLASGRTPGGVHLSLEVSKYSTHRACIIEVVGEKGQLFGDYLRPRLLIGRGEVRAEAPEVIAAPTIPPMLEDFERWIRGEIDNPIPLAEGVRAVAAADRCYELAGA